MAQFLAFFLLGLGAGAVAASFGVSVIVLHKGTGIINFAQASIAMWGAYVYNDLTRNGKFILPLFGIPSSIRVGHHVPVVLALVLAVISAAVLGMILHAIIFRRMARAPVLAQVVATIGIMLAIQGMATLYFGAATVTPVPVLPQSTVTIGGLAVTTDRLLLVPITVCVALALWAWFRYSRTGLGCRAAAENPTGALVTGLSTNRLGLTSWGIACGISGLFGVLAAPLIGISPDTYPLLIVPALAAALVGRLSGLGATVTAGLLIGGFQSSISYFLAKGWLPSWAQSGLPETVPLVVIVIVLAIAGRSLPVRSTTIEGRLPKITVPRHVVPNALLATTVGAVAIVLLQGQYRLALLVTIVGAIICLSLVVLTGMAGQISFAQATFAGVAAFALSKLASAYGVPFPLGPLIAIVVATLVGVLFGLPALRIRGAQLGVVTIALALSAGYLVFNNTALLNSDDLAPIPNPTIAGVNVGPYGSGFPRIGFSLAALAIAVVLFVATAIMSKGRFGMKLRAVRSSELAAAAGGINVTAVKIGAFAVSSVIAAFGGVLLGYLYGQASPDSFSVSTGLSFLAIAYLGGITSIPGALIGGLLVSGGILFTVINNHFNLGNYYLLITGLGLILTVIDNPDGMAPRLLNLVNGRSHRSENVDKLSAMGSVSPGRAAGALSGASGSTPGPRTPSTPSVVTEPHLL